MTRRLPVFFLLLFGLWPGSARAALTPSEKSVVRTFVEKGVVDTAPRVRALVARPDLTPEEVAEPLRAGLAAAAFDERHERFVDALLFGPGSAASRNLLVPAVVEGLLSRAAARMSDVPLDAGRRITRKERAATDELLRLHAFVDRKIANAGNPPPDGHDASASIRDDALRAAVGRYATHLAAHERWLRGAARAPADLVRLRAQIAATFADLSRGIAGRHETAERLGLEGSLRALFERRGVIVVTDAPVPESRLTEAVRWLEGVPGAAAGLGVWMLGKTNPAGIVARGRVERAGVPLDAGRRPLPADALWPPEVTPSEPDRSSAALAYSVAGLGVARALASDEMLRQRAIAAAARAARAGAEGYLATEAPYVPLGGEDGSTPPAPAAETVLTGAVRLLLLDAPRALDLAIIRASEGRPEPLEQLALALTVLAGGGKTAPLGRVGEGGTITPLDASSIAAADDGTIAFVLDGKRFAVTAGQDGFAVTLDGKPPKPTLLASYREHTEPGNAWKADGADFERLSGAPRAATLDDGRFLLDGGKGGFDAIASGPEAEDVEVSAVVRVSRAAGAVLARASAGESSYAGVGLVLDVDPPRARLLSFDGRGKAFQLAEPVPLSPAPAEGYATSLRVQGDKITAKVGDRSLEAALPAALGGGRAGLAAMSGARLEVRRFRVTTKPEVPTKKSAPGPKKK